MTAVNGFPLMLNQEVPLGHGYAAEAFRAEHYDATSGGNGVGSPTALKVQAQPAPDGTIRANPGGATLVSTYAGHEGQSYHAYFGGPRTLQVSPTGSSAGGRTDLVVAQVCDPEHDNHWSYDGEYPIPADVAKDMDFQRIHVFEGLDRTAHLDFPHALLAEINRPANTTIVAPEHITDLRELANPKTEMHMFAHNLQQSERQGVESVTTVWPTAGTHLMRIPDWADRMQIQATWGTVRSHHEHGDSGSVSNGTVRMRFYLGSDEQSTEISRWNTSGQQESERFSIVLSDSFAVRPSFKGKIVEAQFWGNKTTGPNVTADGASSVSLIVFFSQGVA